MNKILRTCSLLSVMAVLLPVVSFGQWLQTNGPGGHSRVASLEVSDTLLIAGTSEHTSGGGSVFLSTNNGTTWIPTRLNDGVVRDLAVKPVGQGRSVLFAATSGVSFCNCGAVLRSTDNGETWTDVIGFSRDTGFTSLAVSGNILFAGTDGGGVYLSTNNGTSWAAVNAGLTNRYVSILAVDGSDLFAGTSYNAFATGGLFVSSNDGMTWRLTSLGAGGVQALAVSGTKLYASVNCGPSCGAYFSLSTDNGTTWTSGRDFTMEGGISAFAVSPNGAGGTNLFAGTADSGVFLSIDNGRTWSSVNRGLMDTHVHSLASNGTYLFAGTDSVVWRRPLSEMVTSVERRSADVPAHFSLNQNYPNPFNPTTHFEFRIPNFGFVSLKVFDLVGREVATLVDGQLTSGRHEVTWDAGGFTSGVYFYRLSAQGFTQTKRLVLLR